MRVRMHCMRCQILMTGLLMCLWLAMAPSLASAGKKNPPPSLPPIEVLDEVRVGRHPLGVATYSNPDEPGQALAVVANRNNGNVSVVDLLKLSMLSEFEVGRRPTGVAIHAATGIAVVTLDVEHAVAVVDPLHTTVLRNIPVGRKPAGVAIDPDLNLAVVANTNSNTVSLINLHTLVATTQIAVGKRPFGVAVNPRTHIAAVTNRGDGTVTLLNLANLASPIAGVITLPHAAYGHHCRKDDRDERKERKATKEDKKDEKAQRCDAGKRARPLGIAFDYSATENRFVVADAGAEAVHIVTLNSNNQLAGLRSLAVGKKPAAVAVNPGRDFALVTSDKREVFGITLSSPAVVATARVGKHPRGVAIDPLSCRAAVTNFGDKTVSVLTTSCNVLQLLALSPSTVQKGSSFTLRLAGTGFGNDSRVNVGSTSGLVPTSITPGLITITLTAPNTIGSIPVSVTSNNQTSNTLNLLVISGQPLSLSSVSPATATANGAALTLTLNGQRFVSGAVVLFDGQELETTFGNAQQLTAIVPGLGLTLHGGTFAVQVRNPDGTLSNTLPVLLRNPIPTIGSLLPDNVTHGASDTQVLVNGNGFVAQTVGDQLVAVTQVRFNGTPVPAVPVEASPTLQLSVTIPSAMLQTPGVFQVTAVNPGPGGGATVVSQPFTVFPDTLPPDVTVATLAIPEGQATSVAIFQQGSTLVGAAILQDAGALQLLNLTDPENPALLEGGLISLSASTLGSDLAVHPTTRTLVVTLPSTNQVAIVTFHINDSVVTNVEVTKRNVLPVPGSAIPPIPGAVTIDAANNRAVVVNQGDSTLSIIDLENAEAPQPRIDLSEFVDEDSEEILAFIALYNMPATSTTPFAAVVNQPVDESTPGSLLLVDLTSAAVSVVQVGNIPSAVAVDTSINTAVVANQYDNTISLIDLITQSVIAPPPPVGVEPGGVAIDPATHVTLVTSFGDNRLTAVSLMNPYDSVTLQLGSGGAITPLDIAWQPDPALGVVLMSQLISPTEVYSIIVLGLPPDILP